MANRIQFRRGTAAEAGAANPVLAEGEFAYETDTKQFKIGDGVTEYGLLPYGGIQGPQGDTLWEGSARTISTSDPDDAVGDDGDFWFKVEA